MAPSPGSTMIVIDDRVALLSNVHIATTILLLLLCLVPFVARMYVRIWPVWRFGVDDGFIVAGLLCALTDWALLVRELFVKPQEITWEDASLAITLAYFAIPVWTIAMTLIKTSIVLTLFRLPLNWPWKIALYILLAIQLTFGFANTLFCFVKCQPYRAAWDMNVVDKHCPGEAIDIIVSNIASAINIATDLVLSVAPMFIFWNLRRPLRERILICSLTGIGLFATFASVMKVVIIAQWTGAEDRWATAISIGTWTITEQFVSVSAACSPSLKKPIENLLNKFGIPLVQPEPNISFVHVPANMREREVRRQAREWMGDGNTPVSPVTSHLMNKAFRGEDVENMGGKCVSTSTSVSASDAAPQTT